MTESLPEQDRATSAPTSCTTDSHSIAARFAALSHPARIEILKRLSASGFCCCRDVVDHLDLAQSTVSQHLKILVEAGLVRFAPDRQRSRYEVDQAALAGVSASLSALVVSCSTSR
ncbi:MULTISPECIES: metalloregulator ArsR/SmtB family transcription factor [unclassified Mesorhizobium]|uniref:ArsR/SmtB family transcription factor n=1 Tax=unclassified Mesorhizobium TaxID=325217 RepID=UPI00112D93AE|nr:MULTISPECIES: metalloregulator ArsR/SmtB family transcription factor [unclassified Mesorhizobium]MCA0026257.1 metalloregulator ArsR/SmtB family transcription factor [Mesorhizobium sp. B263B1A]TPJ96494.1 helix-turn-helix transcriptional regulator [Mesorhizobium sp. B2-5-12]TPK29300.1 helix-turn-helix transcriptional regulator [Mesorhizobium sp. B2-5-6]TPK30077.1 helix-turn-helix transcriptional regulator [Mesorhizobium sp. B2-5-3]TPK60265.1 helix-turn-helix transcriptional regulator [Mesorhi